jgi:type I restriction enzyme S subunit
MSTFKKVQIGDVCTVTKGATGIQKAVAGEYPMVTLAEERTTHNEFQFDCKAVIIPLVSSTGHGHASMKRVHYQEGKFALGSILCAVVPNDPNFLNPKYLHIYLSYLKDRLLVSLMRGAANVSLSISNIKNVEVIVPPIERQIEIIELEKVLKSQKQKLDKQNSFQKAHLDFLRQQILQDAISGKLTVDWRAENPDIEPAGKLLEQIKAEKEKLIAEKKIKQEKPLPKIAENEVPFDLPEGWEWCRLGEMGLVTRGKSPKYEKKSDVFSLNQKCVRWNHVDTEFAKEVNRDWLNEIDSNFLTKEEDILVNSTGEGTIGRSAIVDEQSAKMIFDSHILCFKKLGNIASKFVMFLINGQFGQRQINDSKGAKSTKQTELGVGNLKNLMIPLPPRAEQRAIVAKIEKLMGYVSQLEEKIAQNANNAEILMRTFLSEFFQEVTTTL